MLTNKWFALIMAVYFSAIVVGLVFFGCQEKTWTTNPEAWQTPATKAISVETATIGVRATNNQEE